MILTVTALATTFGLHTLQHSPAYRRRPFSGASAHYRNWSASLKHRFCWTIDRSGLPDFTLTGVEIVAEQAR
jgi:hypothetical protein